MIVKGRIVSRTRLHDMHLDSETLRPSGALLAAQIALAAAIERDAVSRSGHDATTLDLLVRLDLAPGRALRAVELCDQLLLSASHVSRMLDRAEEASLVQRRPDPDDRRANQVVLTEEGLEVVSAFAPDLQATLDRVFRQNFDPGELDMLVDLLERVEEVAREPPSSEDIDP